MGREEPLAEGVRREEGPVCSGRAPPWGQVRVGERVSSQRNWLCSAEPRQGALCSFFFFDFNFFYFFGLKKKKANDCSVSRGKSSFYSLYLPYFFSSPHVIVRIKSPLHPSELREGWCGFFFFTFFTHIFTF